MQEIENGIFIETMYPGVTLGALVFAHGTLLIDAPLRPEDNRSWRSALINQGSSANRVLINLDAHPDRTLGARALECTIIAHQKTAQVFRSRPLVFKGQNIDSGAEWETYSDAVGTRWAMPDITFTNRIFLHWGPPDVVIEHHPGSAPGAIWVIIPDYKIIFVGDAVLHNQPPFLATADIPAWQVALELLLTSYKDHLIISGREGAVPYEAIRAQNHLLKRIFKGLEKIAKRNATPGATESLIPSIMGEIDFPAHLEEQYAQRLKHGLNQYYLHLYRPMDIVNQSKLIDAEQ